MDKRLVEKKYFLWRMFTFSGYISPGQFWSEIAIRVIGFFLCSDHTVYCAFGYDAGRCGACRCACECFGAHSGCFVVDSDHSPDQTASAGCRLLG